MIDKAIGLIAAYDLGHAVKYILEHNKSQALPYHNFNHALWVMVNAYEIYQGSKSPDDIDCPKEVLLAALFHDFDHSGGFFRDDSHNINDALRGFMSWQMEYNTGQERSNTDYWEMTLNAESLILETEFPHGKFIYENYINEYGISNDTRDNDHYRLMANSLRDADLFQNLNDTLLGNMVGIKQELWKHLDWSEYIDKSIEFLGTLSYKTKYGQEIGTPLLQEAIQKLKAFKKLTGL